MNHSEEMMLQRASVRLLKHNETYMYASVLLLGNTEVVEDFPTACTDGINEKYGREFIREMSIEQIAYVRLHEGLHKFLKHVMRYKSLAMEDPKLANAAMDYVVNDIIENLSDKTLVARPTKVKPLYDPKFHNWSVQEVYNFLKTGQNKDGNKEGTPQPKDGDGNPIDQQSQGQGQQEDEQDNVEQVEIGGKDYSLSTSDEHDHSVVDSASEEELQDLSDAVDEVVQQAGLLAGMRGQTLPRAVLELFEPTVDWRVELSEFIENVSRGKDEYTWRRLNRRREVFDIYSPSRYSESIDEIVVAIDTSGSINQKILSEFATELATICTTVMPKQVRVLWWDTSVNSEQLFENDYDDLPTKLCPAGFGGTRVSCVSEYINQYQLQPECVIVLTDGYVEDNVHWDIAAPTLWMVTHNNAFDPPSGKKVKCQ